MASGGGFNMKYPNNQKLLIGVILLLGISYGWFDMIYTPKAEEIKKQSEAREQVLQKLTQTQAKARQLPKLKQELRSLWEDYLRLSKLLPDDRDVPGFLSQTQRAASQSQVVVTELEPQGPTAQDFVIRNPYVFKMKATYRNVGDFLSFVANFPFLTGVDQVELLQNVPGPRDPTTLNAKFTVNSYTVDKSKSLGSIDIDALTK